MSMEFASRVEQGVQLLKRIYYGKGVIAPVVPERPPEKPSPESFLPTSVMAYASVADPASVDNPDVPSYQPYVYARCDPPALVPLHMLGVEMSVDCWLDTAFVTVKGLWRVHCLMTCKRCDCCVAVPIGETGSLLGADVDIIGSGRSYKTKLIAAKEAVEMENACKDKDSRVLKSSIFTFNIPQVAGGSVFSVEVTWSQKLLYQDGQFRLNLPFRFPAYVVPVGKDTVKIENILLNMNSGTGQDILCSCSSHPLKVLNREFGKLSCVYEAEVSAWSNIDFNVSFAVSLSDISGGMLLQSPSPWDSDERGLFCLYLLPGMNQHRQVFRRKVIFVIDTSGSMQGRPLEAVKRALCVALSKLNSKDHFNIIGFNEEILLFSSPMEPATTEAISRAAEWLDSHLIAGGGTNILLPLKKAMKTLAETNDAIPLIFLVTDGSVEDERGICDAVKAYCKSGGLIFPRICTYGIGLFCNHYFLQTLAQIGKGHHDAAYDPDSIESHMLRLFDTASSTIVANISLDALKLVGSVELFPSHIPDLTQTTPLVISGRYKGQFPDFVEVRGTLADMSCFSLELTSQKAKDIPLDKVLVRRQIDDLTARAWDSQSNELEEKVIRLSLQKGFPSEYTQLILLNADEKCLEAKPVSIKEILQNPLHQIQNQDKSNQNRILLGCLGLGFGDQALTVKNLPPGSEEPKKPEGAEALVAAATGLCGRCLDRFCCMCFLQTCSRMNDQCSIVLSQLCAALACFECLSCCCELCECFDF